MNAFRRCKFVAVLVVVLARFRVLHHVRGADVADVAIEDRRVFGSVDVGLHVRNHVMLKRVTFLGRGRGMVEEEGGYGTLNYRYLLLVAWLAPHERGAALDVCVRSL